MHNKEVNICLVGFGNAAQEFCRMLITKRPEVKESRGYDIKVTAIAGRSKGGIINARGIDLTKVLRDVEDSGRFDSTAEDTVTMETLQIIRNCNANLLVELSSLSIHDGEPAITHIETAFDRGMHVITGNKGPIAFKYQKLRDNSKEKGLQFLYETTVMDGTPIFNFVKCTLPGCKVLSFKGILNSTTNFVLEQMESGNSYEDAIKEAKRRGFAEADPTLDIDGWDAAAKTAALLNVLMDTNINPTEIDRKGISHITLEDIEKAKVENCKIKLICEGYIEDNKVKGRVHPVYINYKDTFSNIDATSSILAITTDLMGEVQIIEKNPEIQQTAYGIYSDLLTLIKTL
ncbi:homoserine dehydrogenase [Clostridium tagluense]|uniref:homoserine dehydrogenase n=1 Tax=Clostridium tagluense TaxID=360422 RepID=UPI001CF1C923|nr:homoserine dehydrogenase [Clostridium tagluense]MCB2311284.1 homoserine dehydrogenase [Clostridium tagluense]MCB2316074.1 homoserine dehydrogenase [Clostridium tagluense]MCB2320860.1 homoserine dehydrogenase [Clostridium tagluense]MCB2325943.1 homoserine dehydrogenase [Clostridium tagluense]MCB2330600.1 homoserine dehydrogenase [Clostridium tagluense]